MDSPQLQTPITKEEFNSQYWFNSLQMIEVINPRKDDYPFMVEMRHFFIKAGASERFPGVIANVYLDQMSKLMSQDDENLGMMADPNLKKIYYDKLIVNVEELAPVVDQEPAYLKNVSPSARPLQPDNETPPWERASSVQAPSKAPEPDTPAPEPEPVKIENKEFEQGGSTFKLVIGKDGRKMYYQDGRLTDAGSYNKAASML